MRWNRLVLTKVTIMLLRKTTFCLGEIACWSRKLKSRVVKGLLTVSEIRDATPLEFRCQFAAGERLAKGGMGNQQHERSNTQDDMHFPQDIDDSTQRLWYLYVLKYPVTRTILPYYLAGLPISILCTVLIMSLLLDCAMTGLNKCNTRPTNSSTTVITSFSNLGWFPTWSTKFLFIYI